MFLSGWVNARSDKLTELNPIESIAKITVVGIKGEQIKGARKNPSHFKN